MDLLEQTLNVLLAALLIVGNLLALPIWWRLLGAPVVQLWKRHRKSVRVVVL